MNSFVYKLEESDDIKTIRLPSEKPWKAWYELTVRRCGR